LRGSGVHELARDGADFLADEKRPESLVRTILGACLHDLRQVGVRKAHGRHPAPLWTTVFPARFGLCARWIACRGKGGGIQLLLPPPF
jgi:hypothetical protein